MRLKHTKYFVAFYIVALAMMGTPLVGIANRPELVLVCRCCLYGC